MKNEWAKWNINSWLCKLTGAPSFCLHFDSTADIVSWPACQATLLFYFPKLASLAWFWTENDTFCTNNKPLCFLIFFLLLHFKLYKHNLERNKEKVIPPFVPTPTKCLINYILCNHGQKRICLNANLLYFCERPINTHIRKFAFILWIIPTLALFMNFCIMSFWPVW